MCRLTLVAWWFLLCMTSFSYASVQENFKSLHNQPEKLYTFLKEMPKGGELHYHYDGAVYAETMLHLSAKSNFCVEPIHFNSMPCQKNSPLLSIQKILDQPALYPKTIRAWSMLDIHTKTSHDHFFAVFPKVGALYDAFRGPFLAEILKKAAAQHELYMEIIAYGLNSDAYAKLIQSAATFEEKRAILIANKAFQQSVQEIVLDSQSFLNKAHQALHCAQDPQQPACQITVRYQFFVRRDLPINSVFAQALAGFMSAERSPDIVAVNLVGMEDNAISQRDYKTQMQIFEMLHQHYPNVHITLHAGELFPLSAAKHSVQSPIREAILIGHAQRIGHGLDIQDEPHPNQLAQMMMEKNIPVEINLTSNQLIYNIPSKQHPLPFYLHHEVPVVLSTDDEGILRTHLTHEYFKAVTQYHLDYDTLKQINRNTLTYAFIEGQSLWQNPKQAQPVPACQTMQNARCKAFIKQSAKARLQWDLENQLTKFEEKY